MMFTWPNEHNRLLREVKCVYKLMDSTCASMTSKDDYVMFRRMNCIAENVARLVPRKNNFTNVEIDLLCSTSLH